MTNSVQQVVMLRNAVSSKTGSKLAMPRVGLGTWKAEVGKTRDAVVTAIRDGGYRLVDTANDYGNEHEVGSALKYCFQEGICKREDLFVQCKLWQGNMSKELVKYDLMASLKDLNLDYVDSYVLHWPMACPKDPELKMPTFAWSIMEHSTVTIYV
jgi:diketogulonate reductase-like aldo/keto reductase